MKRLERALMLSAVLLTVALLAVPARAGGCRTVVRTGRTAYAPAAAYQEQITVTRTLKAASYDYGNHGSVYNEGVAEDKKLIRELIDRYAETVGKYATLAERQRAGGGQQVAPAPRLQPMEAEPDGPGRPQGSPEQAPPPPKAQPASGDEAAEATKLFVARCASCHEAAAAVKKGGGFTLLNGGAIAPLTDKHVKDILIRMYSDDPEIAMPKGGKPLADPEVAVAFRWAAKRK